MLKKYFTIHPFIFSLLPLFHLYIVNFYEYPMFVILKPLIALICLTFFSLILLRLIINDKYKVSVIFSFSILMIFVFNSYNEMFSKDFLRILSFRCIFIIYLLFFLGILIFFIKTPLSLKKLSVFFNIAGLAISLFMFINSINVISEKKGNLVRDNQGDRIVLTHIAKKTYMPNIYYIILDSYPDKEEMKSIIGFDNSDFINYLRMKGFFVANKSRSNYNFTKLSIASTLNMNFLPMLKIADNTYELKQKIVFSKAIEKSEVISFLKSLGYRYIDLSIWNNRFYNIDFTGSLLLMTPLSAPRIGNYICGLLLKNYVLDTLDKLERLTAPDEPFFVYAHIYIPHFPAMFDENGDTPSFFKSDKKTLYLEQLKYTNKRIKKIIDSILLNSKKKPVIIIQGDHGINSLTGDRDKNIRLRTSILNAAYIPESKKNVFYDGMTSVNTFRIIFNRYFGTDLKLLPDITYYQDYENGRLFVYKKNERQ